MFLFTNKIERLVKKIAKLEVKRQEEKDRVQSREAAIGNKLQRLENKSFVMKKNSDNILAEYDRQIQKTKEQIRLEKKYNDSIGSDVEVEDEELCCSYSELKKLSGGNKHTNRNSKK